MGQGNVALAFGLVLAAGASSAVGAAAVFVAHHTNHMLLAASLGVSAGVMMYISIVEIFTSKSVKGFSDAGYTNAESTRYATLCFFGGMVILWLLDKIVHALLHLARKNGRQQWHMCKAGPQALTCSEAPGTVTVDAPTAPMSVPARAVCLSAPPVGAAAPLTQAVLAGDAPTTSEATTAGAGPPTPPCCVRHCASTGALPLDKAVPATAAAAATAHVCEGQVQPQYGEQPWLKLAKAAEGGTSTMSDLRDDLTSFDEPHRGVPARLPQANEAVAVVVAEAEAEAQEPGAPHKSLARMGLLAALAIAIHNAPEGLATFVATLADPKAGIVVALAIICHNIPEGIVVSMPVFFASGSRWRGFFWGCMSAVTEPIGALVGYAVLHDGEELNPMVYALMFGLVAGMMVYISLTELLPTAFKYDPDDRVATKALVLGMAVMALSLLLFQI